MCVLYLMEKSRSGEVAIGGRGCHREIVSTRRSRDRERSPLGEEVAIRRSFLHEEVAIRRSLLQGRCQGEVAIRRSLLQQCHWGNRSPLGEGKVAIRRSLLQGKMSLKKNKAVEFPPPLCRLVHIDLSLKHLCYSRDDFNSPQVVVALPAAPMCPLRRCARVRVWRFPSNETSSIW